MSKSSTDTMEKVVNLCKRRGFVFQSSEIYGGFAGVYDYGPYGIELLNNIKNAWWRSMVQLNPEIVGLDSAIFMSPRIWEASGHVGGFSDPLTECKQCHNRQRADHLLEDIGVAADEKMTPEEITDLLVENKEKIACPVCGTKDFTEAKNFNLLVESNLGDFSGEGKEPVYLRGETAQGIYVNYKNVLNSNRVKVPFGIAQIGKAFRNEITARQFIFRTREFEQMEMQYFVEPEKEMEFYEKWKQIRWDFYINMGVKKENLRWKQHENLVFYAKEAYDIEYKFPFGFKELEGLHARGDYDLTQHAKHSNENLEYFDQKNNKKFIPHIVETSTGAGRNMLMWLVEAYHEEELEDGKTRVVMKFPHKIAPVKIAIFPLLKNKPELTNKAEEVFNALKQEWMCEYDDNGNVGKRYRRQDEIGTPFCVTIDFDTLEDQTVTIRNRDTMEQERVGIEELHEYFKQKMN